MKLTKEQVNDLFRNIETHCYNCIYGETDGMKPPCRNCGDYRLFEAKDSFIDKVNELLEGK